MMFNIWAKTNYIKRVKAMLEKTDHRSGNEKLYDRLSKEGCPDCNSVEFYEGPHGGLSVNIKCAGCGSKFNIASPIGWAERI